MRLREILLSIKARVQNSGNFGGYFEENFRKYTNNITFRRPYCV
jgi:hypothetical protein